MALQVFYRRCLTLAVGIGMALLIAGGAHADITIVGGTPAQQVEIQSVYTSLPDCCHRNCPICVQVLDDSAMDSYLQACAAAQSVKLVNAGSVDGLFQNATPTISLRGTDATDVSSTFAHEYGHFVWLNILSRAQRDQYAKTYKAQKAAHHLVSAYAEVSVEEGFAEAFSFYNLQKPLLAQRDDMSCCFLSNCLTPCSH